MGCDLSVRGEDDAERVRMQVHCEDEAGECAGD